jgi:hypothetical protein
MQPLLEECRHFALVNEPRKRDIPDPKDLIPDLPVLPVQMSPGLWLHPDGGEAGHTVDDFSPLDSALFDDDPSLNLESFAAYSNVPFSPHALPRRVNARLT